MWFSILVFRQKPEALCINSLAVAPEYRRLGIAIYILNYATQVAKQLNKKWLELVVFEVNIPALRLHKKLGFIKKEKKKWSFILRKKSI